MKENFSLEDLRLAIGFGRAFWDRYYGT